MGEIADKVVEKNFQLQERDVFTNSAEFGIIDQKDFFDHEIVNKNNIGRYYIVSPNDFVYNPRISVTAPVGPINRNKLCKRGIMSPLYTVFHPRNMNEIFLEFFFKTNKWHKFMEYNGDSGARSDRFSIKTELFYAMTIPFPSHEEQSKVGICFDSLDHLITLHQSKSFGHILKVIVSCTLSWEQRKLGEVFVEYSEKNHSELPPLTIIQGGGTIRRDESDRALQYDKGSLSNYKMVNKGDFIVHLRSFEGGLEKANSTGIISPAYHTLSGENTDTTFYYAYFRSKKFIESDLKPHVYGIRDGRSIDIEGMKTINIPYTILEEQRRIGKFIDSLDHLITLHQLEPFQLIFKAIAYRIIDYAKSKPPRCRKYTGFIAFINTMYKNCVYTQYNHLYSLKSYYIKDIILLIKSAYICKIII